MFGFLSSKYHWVTLGFSGFLGFAAMNVLNVGFWVGFDFVGFRLFPRFWVFGYLTSSLPLSQKKLLSSGKTRDKIAPAAPPLSEVCKTFWVL